MDALHRKFSRRVKERMAEKKLSINRLADFAGLGRGRVSEILTGKTSPTLRTIGKIADALETSAGALVPDDEPGPREATPHRRR
jgi:transcriptional regulator with XRE-family HTH domain